MEMKEVERMVVLPDVHLSTAPGATEAEWVPDVNDSFWLALDFCLDFKPHIIMILGDFMDLDLLGLKEPGDRLAYERRRLRHDFELANRVLDFMDGLKPKRKIYVFGNHEIWINKYVAQNPILKGYIGIIDGLGLINRGWEIVPCGETIRIGSATFTHGWYTNQYHAAKTVRETGTNIFYGHAHTLQSFSKPNINGKPIIGQCLGCLAKTSPPYWNRPSGAINSFGVFYIKKNGDFHFYTPIIIDGETIFNGKIYKSPGPQVLDKIKNRRSNV